MKTVMVPREAVHTGNLILVNARFPLVRQSAAPALVRVGGGTPSVLLEREAAVSLAGLMELLDGWRSITPVSGWRSMEEQEDIYARSLRDSGEAFTRKFVALPGHSEHQTGLAVDLGLSQPEIDFIRPEFPDFGVCRAFRRRAAAFGFIERYPAGKEAVTGIGHEPWHFRYVGTPHAAIMDKLRLTLEEYHGLLKKPPRGRTGLTHREGRLWVTVSYAAADDRGDTCLELDGACSCTVSGNNMDGFVVTEWRV